MPSKEPQLGEPSKLTFRGGLPLTGVAVKEGAGCIRCRNTGYFGRTGIFEILPIDNAIRDLIDHSEDFLKIKDMAIKRGMRTLRQSALRKLAEGITSFEEVVRVTGI